MYKTAALAAALASALAYFLYLSPQFTLNSLASLNITAHTDMALQSVSRQVVKKVLAVETHEVRASYVQSRASNSR